MKLGERMREVRLKHNLKQREVAEKMTVSTSYICRVELGKEKPTEMFVLLFCYTFGISKESLLDGDNDVADSQGSSGTT